MLKSRISVMAAAIALILAAPVVQAGTFGTPVVIGGQASDIALDEGHGFLYIANFTANRIDVMSLATNQITRSMNVANQPGSIAISPDKQYLLVAHYGASGLLTLINLASGSRQTYTVDATPLAVAFGGDGIAFVVTTKDFRLLDPGAGKWTTIDTVADVTGKALPVSVGTFPPTIIACSLGVSEDGKVIYGLSDTIRFSYDLRTKLIISNGYIAAPPLGPRVVSVNRDGSFYAAGWGVFGCGLTAVGGCDAGGPLIAEFPSPSGILNVGSHAIDSDSNTMYAQIPLTATDPPVLMIADADNLNVRERIQLPENLAGKSLLNANKDTMYSVSDSGVMVLPVGTLNQTHRLKATQEDVIFRGSFCDRNATRQTLTIVDPGGGNTDFELTTSLKGVTIYPAAGTTPATVTITVDPSAFAGHDGTVAGVIQIGSFSAVNIIKPVSLLVNTRQPDQRGTILDIPGNLVDLLADPVRNRFYILRQDNNSILVFDGTTYAQIATLRTSNTPTQLAFTLDRKYLMVGHNDSQLAYYYDLDALQPAGYLQMPFGHYPKSIAQAGGATLAATRVAGAVNTIDLIDFQGGQATTPASLGVFTNSININTVLLASPSGSSIMAMSPDGNMLLYNSSANTFTAARKQPAALGGAYAASVNDTYVIGNTLYNSSAAPVGQVDTSATVNTGFAFMDQGAISTAPGPSAGVIKRVTLGSPQSALSTRTAESPLGPSATNAFSRTLAPLSNGKVIVSLTTSGVVVYPVAFDAGIALPQISQIVNAADLSTPVAPGGLVTIFGSSLVPVTDATKELPIPTALAQSCMTVNGVLTPMTFASPGQINAQLPPSVVGGATVVLRTPGGISDNFNLSVQSTAPGVFRTNGGAPTVYRDEDGKLISDSTPIHLNDKITIYLTGMGATAPFVNAGFPAPANPLAVTMTQPTVAIGGTGLFVSYAGLVPGQAGVYQINAQVPFHHVPTGSSIPLTITQGGMSTTVNVAVSE